MPLRKTYQNELIDALRSMPIEFATVSAFGPKAYAGIVEYTRSPGDDVPGISSEDIGEYASKVVKEWTKVHQVSSGSDSRYLAVLYGEESSGMEEKDKNRLLQQLIQEVDGAADKMSSADEGSGFKSTNAFLRIPVLPNIYDILVYAHRDHDTAIETLHAATEAGFVRLSFPLT